MIISKKTKTTRQAPNKFSCVRISFNRGSFVFNKLARELLEIEDITTDGIVFGYQGDKVYVAYSNEDNAYRGGFKKTEQSFRFTCKEEALKIMELTDCNPNEFISFKIDSNVFVVVDNYKLYELIKINE